jgi:hypothetical protein
MPAGRITVLGVLPLRAATGSPGRALRREVLGEACSIKTPWRPRRARRRAAHSVRSAGGRYAGREAALNEKLKARYGKVLRAPGPPICPGAGPTPPTSAPRLAWARPVRRARSSTAWAPAQHHAALAPPHPDARLRWRRAAMPMGERCRCGAGPQRRGARRAVMGQVTAWTMRRGCMPESVPGVAAGQPEWCW